MRDRGSSPTQAHKQAVSSNALDRYIQQPARPPGAIPRSLLVDDACQLPTRFISKIYTWDLVNEKFGDGSSGRHATQLRSTTTGSSTQTRRHRQRRV